MPLCVQLEGMTSARRPTQIGSGARGMKQCRTAQSPAPVALPRYCVCSAITNSSEQSSRRAAVHAVSSWAITPAPTPNSCSCQRCCLSLAPQQPVSPSLPLLLSSQTTTTPGLHRLPSPSTATSHLRTPTRRRLPRHYPSLRHGPPNPTRYLPHHYPSLRHGPLLAPGTCPALSTPNPTRYLPLPLQTRQPRAAAGHRQTLHIADDTCVCHSASWYVQHERQRGRNCAGMKPKAGCR